MKFSQAARNESVFTRTENGAVALKTTSDARLDLFGVIGSLRGAEKVRIERLFSEAYHAGDWASAKLSGLSSATWRRCIRRHCVRIWI